MPQLINVVGRGMVSFPDGMSQNQIADVLNTNPPPEPKPETSGQSVLGWISGVHGPEAGATFMNELKTVGDSLGKSLVPTPRFSDKTAEKVGRAGIFAVGSTVTPMLGSLLANVIPETVARGVGKEFQQNIDFLTSPAGFAMLATGMEGVPMLVKRAVAAGFSVVMGRQTPELARQAGDASGRGDTEEASRLILQAAQSIFGAAAGAAGAVAAKPVSSVTRTKPPPLSTSDSAAKSLISGARAKAPQLTQAAAEAEKPVVRTEPEPNPSEPVREQPLAISGEIGKDATPAIQTPDGTVATGEDHVAAYEKAKATGTPDTSGSQEGFVDSAGKFLTREEAADQTGLPTSTEPGKLHSSDLPTPTESPTSAGKEGAKQAQATAEPTAVKDHTSPDATPEERLASAAKEPDPVKAIIGPESTEDFIGERGFKSLFTPDEPRPGLASVGDKLDEAITKANEPGKGGIERDPAKPKEATIEVKPSQALKTVLKASEKAGEAGVKRGRAEGIEEMRPKVEALKTALSQSVSKAKALGMYFAGQEKGSAIGAKAKSQQLEMANRWWNAQRRGIAASLLQITRESLPIADRSQFMGRITRLVTEPMKLIGPESEAMYDKAAQLAAEIVAKGEDVQRANLVTEIKASLKKFSESPSVDAYYRKKISRLADGLTLKQLSSESRKVLERTRAYLDRESAAGHDVTVPDYVHSELERLHSVPLKDLPYGDLIALRDKMKHLAEIGKLKVRTRQAIEQFFKERALEDLKSSTTAPLEQLPEFSTPMKDENLALRFNNWWNRFRNQVKVTGNAILPMDALMDLMDGGKADFMGWLHRNLRGPVDLNEQAKFARHNELLRDYRKVAQETKLTKAQREKVSAYAYAQQPDARAHLIASGIPESQLKGLTLTPSENRYFDSMRRVLDKLAPEVQRTKYKLDNEVFDMVTDYFPVQRDWKRYADSPTPEETLQTGHLPPVDMNFIDGNLKADFNPRPKVSVKQGFTKERVGGAMPIKLDAADIFESHVADAIHYIYQQPTLRRLSALVSDPVFREKYGDIGQRFMVDWINTVARDGHVDPSKRVPPLDFLRRNSNLAIIGFRLGSQLKHLSNWPWAMAHIGPGWFQKGLMASFSPEGRAFIENNLGETQRRSGGEPAIAETERGPVSKIAFMLVRELDRTSAEATAIGAYQREIARRGGNPETALTDPVNLDALRLSLVRTRRSVASPLAKDVPLAISKGTGIGGNVSVARTLMQFNNVFLDRWSNMRLEFGNRGLADLAKGDPKQAAKFMAAFASSAAIASAVTYGWREAKYAMSSKRPKKPKTLEEDVIEDTIKQFPFMGQLMSAAMFGEPIPALSVPVETAQHGYRLITGKNQYGGKMKSKQREAEAIRFAGRAAGFFGIPALEVSDVLAKRVEK